MSFTLMHQEQMLTVEATDRRCGLTTLPIILRGLCQEIHSQDCTRVQEDQASSLAIPYFSLVKVITPHPQVREKYMHINLQKFHHNPVERVVAAQVAVAQQVRVQPRRSRSTCRVLQITTAMDCRTICQAITMQPKDQHLVLSLIPTMMRMACSIRLKPIRAPTLIRAIREPIHSIQTPMVMESVTDQLPYLVSVLQVQIRTMEQRLLIHRSFC